MELIVHGHNLDLSPRLEDYAESKVKRLDRKLPDIMEARLELSVESTRSAEDRQIAQLTLRTERGTLLRVEERAADMFVAIDAVLEKMIRQIERYKGKGRKRYERQRRRTAAAVKNGARPALEEAPPTQVLRRKRFTLTPLTEEDAVEQLELLGHPFFVFFHADEKAICVAYRRDDGSYGVLIPELPAIPEI
jgi:putative sigma-54 modulation protein